MLLVLKLFIYDRMNMKTILKKKKLKNQSNWGECRNLTTAMSPKNSLLPLSV